VNAIEEIGRDSTDVFTYAGGIATLFADAIGLIVQLKIRVRETVDQAFVLGVQSWLIVLLTSGFTGAVFALESAVQATEWGVGNLVGGAVAFTMTRELGPLLTAVVVAGRSGAAISAELGSMVVTEQIEALEALGLSPTRMLVVPRLLAMLVMLPLLTVLSEIFGVVSGMWVAAGYAHITTESFMNSVRFMVTFGDVLKGLVKSLVFAMIIALVGAYNGLATRGGAAGVGRATTSAVVIAIILVFAFNVALSYLFFPQH
jgi:phospholipid/cholesterol/gamma-HCH transport system permease protein